MTTPDVETSKRRATPVRNESTGTLSAELVEAGGVLAERSVRLARTAAEMSLRITDAAVAAARQIVDERRKRMAKINSVNNALLAKLAKTHVPPDHWYNGNDDC